MKAVTEYVPSTVIILNARSPISSSNVRIIVRSLTRLPFLSSLKSPVIAERNPDTNCESIDNIEVPSSKIHIPVFL